MRRLENEQKEVSDSVDTRAANTSLSGSWVIIARAVWLALVISILGLFVAGIPVYYQQVQRACVDLSTCSLNGELTAQGLQALPSFGLSTSGYALFFTIFFVILAAIWCGIGFLIFWRRSNDWLALLGAFFLVISGITLSHNSLYALTVVNTVLALPLSLVGFLGQISIGIFLLLFPNGRLVPRWMVLTMLLDILLAFFNNFPSPASSFDENWPGWLYLLVAGVIYASLIYSQIYRYRHISTPFQRQQTKWVVFGVTTVVGIFIGLLVIGAIIPSLDNSLLFNEVWNIIFPIALLLIPLSIGFSILRYRLYDIDLLINRTLVYGTLTALLALIYFGLIFVLQFLFQGFFKQNNGVIIVGSTLAIAALFQPLRHRIQLVIDRRFYRRKYDAAQTLEAFSATLRNEVDLSQLNEHLLNVVQETMQPAHVSLWLRKSVYERKSDTQK